MVGFWLRNLQAFRVPEHPRKKASLRHSQRGSTEQNPIQTRREDSIKMRIPVGYDRQIDSSIAEQIDRCIKT